MRCAKRSNPKLTTESTEENKFNHKGRAGSRRRNRIQSCATELQEDEYQANVKNVLAAYSSLKCTVNDDAMIHPHGNLVWGTATVHEVDTKTDGSKGEGDFRWTVVWEKQGGQWLIVHEHVSVPAGGAPEKKQ